jgi:hypothetical protein
MIEVAREPSDRRGVAIEQLANASGSPANAATPAVGVGRCDGSQHAHSSTQ